MRYIRYRAQLVSVRTLSEDSLIACSGAPQNQASVTGPPVRPPRSVRKGSNCGDSIFRGDAGKTDMGKKPNYELADYGEYGLVRDQCPGRPLLGADAAGASESGDAVVLTDGIRIARF